MGRPDEHRSEWGPDDSIGVVYSEHRRKWQHEWNSYLVMMISLIGVIGVIGALAPFSAPRLAGALGVVAAGGAVYLSDRAARTSRRAELVWLLVALVLAVGGFTLFAMAG